MSAHVSTFPARMEAPREAQADENESVFTLAHGPGNVNNGVLLLIRPTHESQHRERWIAVAPRVAIDEEIEEEKA